MSTFNKSKMDVKFPVGEETPLQSWLIIPMAIALTPRKHISFLSKFAYFQHSPTVFLCSSTRMKNILPSNISPQPDNGKQWPTHFSTFFPISQIEGGSWSLPNVLQPLFPDLWLHVRHMLGRSCCMFAPRGTTDPPVTWPLFYPLLSCSLMLMLFHNINNVQ